MQSENSMNSINFNEDTINIREEIEKYVIYWKWFVLGAVLAVSVAYFYARYLTNMYEVSTTILIDVDNNSLGSELAAFEDLGLMGNSYKLIEDEIELLKSRTLMEEVVKELRLNITYFVEGNVVTSELYSKSSPLKFNLFQPDSLLNQKGATFKIQITSSNNFNLLDGESNLMGNYAFGESIQNDLGDIVIIPTANSNLKEDQEIIINVAPVKNVADRYRNAVQIKLVNDYGSVIKLSLKDPVKQKAEAILNKLVDVYNRNAIADKSSIAKNTNIFIEERLEIINENLLSVESGAEQFKIENSLTDIASEASLALNSKSAIESNIIDLSTQLKLVEFVIDHINTNTNELIPANLGLSNESLGEGAVKYNELLLERNRILKSSSNENPVIVNLNEQLANLRVSITQSLENLKASLTISLQEVQQQEFRLEAKMAEVPRQEREYRSIQRQQQIIEALYLYLLEKREENSILLAVTAPNAKIIDRAYGSDYPVAPNRRIIYLGALLIGLLIPFVIIYSRYVLDNKVHTVKDVEKILSASFLGDIPNTKLSDKVIVSATDRNSDAEAFRMLRTNIDFMLAGVKEGGKTIYVTSTIPNEGKTFISINLASVLALSNKKVLLIGSDMRKPKIAEYLNITERNGLSHFLSNRELKAEAVIKNIPEYNFDIVQAGITPPNPSELLMNGRFEALLAEVKTKYDYIIVDTAPVSLVSDTMLLSKNADLFMYVVRANYLDRRLLEIPKKLYQEKKLPNLAIVLNDTDVRKGYGYGYGYNYGYGYGGEVENIPFWKRILKKYL